MLKLLIVIAVFALITYMVTRRLQERSGKPVVRRPQRPAQPPRAIGPDDDPDFLRDLERRRRKEQKEQKPPEPDA